MTPRKIPTNCVTKNIKDTPVFIHTDCSEAAHRWELCTGMVVAYLSLGVWVAVVLLLLAYMAFGAALEGGAA